MAHVVASISTGPVPHGRLARLTAMLVAVVGSFATSGQRIMTNESCNPIIFLPDFGMLQPRVQNYSSASQCKLWRSC